MLLSRIQALGVCTTSKRSAVGQESVLDMGLLVFQFNRISLVIIVAPLVRDNALGTLVDDLFGRSEFAPCHAPIS